MKAIIYIIVLLLLFTSGCSFEEPDSGLTIYTSDVSDNHSDTHENTGIDEISVLDLSGLLADDQHVIDAESISAIENAVSITLPIMSGDIDMNANGFVSSDWITFIVPTAAIASYRSTFTGVDATFYYIKASPTPASNDYFNIMYRMYDSAMNFHSPLRQVIQMSDATSGSEDSFVEWYLLNNATDNLAMKLYGDGSLWVDSDMSALTFTDRTPFYEGDAIAELSLISGINGEINHDTLPDFAKKNVNRPTSDNKTVIEVERDLGAMISMLTVAVKQLDEKNSLLKNRIDLQDEFIGILADKIDMLLELETNK